MGTSGTLPGLLSEVSFTLLPSDRTLTSEVADCRSPDLWDYSQWEVFIWSLTAGSFVGFGGGRKMSLPFFEIFSTSSLPVDGNCLPSRSQILPGRTEAVFYLWESQSFPQASDLTNAGCEPRVTPQSPNGRGRTSVGKVPGSPARSYFSCNLFLRETWRNSSWSLLEKGSSHSRVNHQNWRESSYCECSSKTLSRGYVGRRMRRSCGSLCGWMTLSRHLLDIFNWRENC